MSTDERPFFSSPRKLSDANLAVFADREIKSSIGTSNTAAQGLRQQINLSVLQGRENENCRKALFRREFDTINTLVQIGQKALRKRVPIRFDARNRRFFSISEGEIERE